MFKQPYHLTINIFKNQKNKTGNQQNKLKEKICFQVLNVNFTFIRYL